MRPAMQMGVYETFETIFRRKSTLDELIADISQFTQTSMLWVCATVVAGLQFWNGVDASPDDVFATLVHSYFDPALRSRMLCGRWNRSPRRVLFHRRQVLLVAKLTIKHCSQGRVDARQNAHLIGEIFLKANDQLDFGLLHDIAARGSVRATRDEYARVVAEMVMSGEDTTIDIKHMISRNHLMLTRFSNELREHPQWIDVAGEYETATGLSLEENEAMIFASHARHGEDLSRILYTNPGALPLKDNNFATTLIHSVKVVAFLDSLSSRPFRMTQELLLKDDGPNDLSIFRKYPLVQQFYNLHLKSAWSGFLVMDNTFLLDKVITGPYWHAVRRHGQNLHSFWGAVFERYLNALMISATSADTTTCYVPDPRPVDNCNEQLCDGLLLSGECLVLLEYKGSIFTAAAKYSGDHQALLAEIEQKLVRVHKSKVKKKGVEQLASAVKSLFAKDGSHRYPAIDITSIKHVYMCLVTLDSIGGTIGMSALLNTFLDDLLDRSQFPFIEIHPLFCLEIEVFEEIVGLLKKASLPSILDCWQNEDGRLLLPLQAVDLSRFGRSQNDWLSTEWSNISKNMAHLLFNRHDVD